MSKFRVSIAVSTGAIAALMLAFCLHGQDSALSGAVAGTAQNHPMRLADGDNGDGQGDSGQDDQDPGDQIQVPEQQEEQQEDDGDGGPG